MDPRRSRRLARVLVLLGACAAVMAGTAAHPAAGQNSTAAQAGHQSFTPAPSDWWW